MGINFDQIISRDNTACEKYDNRKTIFGCCDVLPMWIADMDFAAPEFVMDAIKQRAEHPVLGYSFRDNEYNSAIADWLYRRNGWSVQHDWFDYTPGVVAGLVFALRAFSSKGDGVVIQPPVYPPFSQVIQLNERRLINSPLVEKDGVYTIDFDDLDRKLADAKIFMMSNPHNPSGRVYTKDELTRIGELCVKHDVIIVADEIHSDIIQKPFKHIHIASINKEFAERTMTLIAPSKTFNIAGLSTSVAITPSNELRQRLRKELMSLHAEQGNIFGAVALKAAYQQGDEWVDAMNEYVGRNMDYAVEFFREHLPEIKCRKSEGTYLLWVDFRSMLNRMTHQQIYEFLIKEAHLGLNDGTLFGEEGRGWFRMNIACPLSVLKQALNQLKQAFRG